MIEALVAVESAILLVLVAWLVWDRQRAKAATTVRPPDSTDLIHATAGLIHQVQTERSRLLEALIARSAAELAYIERSTQPLPRAERQPRPNFWTTEDINEQLAAMGDGDPVDRREPMPLGLDGSS